MKINSSLPWKVTSMAVWHTAMWQRQGLAPERPTWLLKGCLALEHDQDGRMKRGRERQERKGRLGFSQSYSTPFPSASFCSMWFPTILLQGDQGLLHWGSEVVLMLQQGLVDPFCDSGNRKIRKMSTVSPQGNWLAQGRPQSYLGNYILSSRLF